MEKKKLMVLVMEMMEKKKNVEVEISMELLLKISFVLEELWLAMEMMNAMKLRKSAGESGHANYEPRPLTVRFGHLTTSDGCGILNLVENSQRYDLFKIVIFTFRLNKCR